MVYWRLIRIHTVTLSIASITIGIFLALKIGVFSYPVSIFLISTAAFFQITANIANDYGDGLRSEDTNRIDKKNAFQSEQISKKKIITILIGSITCSILSGTFLLFLSFSQKFLNTNFFIWFFIGLICIWASLRYSLGKNNHSRNGLGDLSAFIFFGPIAIIGSYFFITHQYNYSLLLESSAMGLLTVSVLNLNNLRDLEVDKQNLRKTVALRLGKFNAKIYQKFLVMLSFILFVVAAFFRFTNWYQWFFFIIFLPILGIAFFLPQSNEKYTSYLKLQCIFILAISLCYSIFLNF